MSQELITDADYQKLLDAVAQQIEYGTARIHDAYKAEVLRTSWNVGRVIVETLPLNKPGALYNGVVIAKLVEKFKRPDTFFYNVIKFYRLYPTLPRTNLSWSHYQYLIRIDDPLERRRLEQKAVREKINTKDLRAYIPAQRKTLVLTDQSTGDKIAYERGMLYHYHILEPDDKHVKDGRMLVDAGFSVERDVRAAKTKSLRSGRLIRAVKVGEDYTVRISPYQTQRLYTYEALVKRVIDGDTMIMRVNLGFRTYITKKMRLRGIDAPEISNALGRRAKIFVQELIDRNPQVVIKTYKEEKYGRFVVDVFTGPKGQDSALIAQEGQYLNQTLLDKGLAVLMM